ncbi:dTDP-4-dehydrorhamnose reductase [Deferribacterales bacterium Es71-Z0220]|jgi:dTDP-4-dehydrorhamnose reductase/dTDP-4-dehydrorhamnose 3,5-epimerase|uniref:dTDP-4-dehydrorhamnose reductase n=1 Tax=Deferrivibrio essentukiensis TaxID=2880922 RepID=UPI001F61B237|nr:dTDP-4-dehydrorhamnose reductase [Deferrivibrio essentukiensis]MCB4205425.1 dTDP-4-dehydrorhamnose reductase [Deferrivibrio essentukiensis]
MKVESTVLKGVLIIETDCFGDNRGWFTESYNKERFAKYGLDTDFVQDNHSYSTQKGVLRGIHFQNNPKAQSKLVRCTKGKILDVVVDLRKGSDTYKKWIAVELSEQNRKQIFIPKGYGHGFVTLTDNVELQYKVDEYYSKECDRSIKYNDPELGINWGVENPILSEKDGNAPYLKDSDCNFSIKVLVTGVNGQLGYDVVLRLKELGIDVIGVDVNDFDITDEIQTVQNILTIKPDVVVHCAAYTAVDKAEEERYKCYSVNTVGTRNIALACKEIDAKMVYISTDYVFDGKGVEPFDENHDTCPINYYGFTKAEGEKIVDEILNKYFIVRTSWVFGINGNNFIKTMLKLSETKDTLKVVNDQYGSPTYTKDLAELICDMIQTNKYGVYHGTNEGYCSWYELAVEIFKISGKDVNVIPVPSEEYPTKAVRPKNSRLSKGNLDANNFKRLPDWKDAVKRYIDSLSEV